MKINLIISVKKKCKICAQIEAPNEYYLKQSGRRYEFLTVQKLLLKRWPKVTFQHIFYVHTTWEQLDINVFFFPKFYSEIVDLKL